MEAQIVFVAVGGNEQLVVVDGSATVEGTEEEGDDPLPETTGNAFQPVPRHERREDKSEAESRKVKSLSLFHLDVV